MQKLSKSVENCCCHSKLAWLLLQKLVGELFWILGGKFGGNLVGFFRTHKIKAQNFRSIFREKIRASKKIFRANFVLQTCHLTLKMKGSTILMLFAVRDFFLSKFVLTLSGDF